MTTSSINTQKTLNAFRLAPKAQSGSTAVAAEPAQPKDAFDSSSKAEATPSLRATFDSIHNSGGDAKARLLDDNAESWNARWKVLESATDTINTQYFCWDHDVFGKAMLGHIFKKATKE